MRSLPGSISIGSRTQQLLVANCQDEEHHILCHSGSYIRRAPLLRQVRPSRWSTCSSEQSGGRYFEQS